MSTGQSSDSQDLLQVTNNVGRLICIVHFLPE